MCEEIGGQILPSSACSMCADRLSRMLSALSLALDLHADLEERKQALLH